MVDQENNILAGNATAEVAGQLGINKLRVVETNGDELVVVKRLDVKANSDLSVDIALADNQVARHNVMIDDDMVIDDLGIEKAEEWGIYEEKEQKVNKPIFIKLKFEKSEEMENCKAEIEDIIAKYECKMSSTKL